MKDDLRGVDIHHRDVAAKTSPTPTGLNALDGEILFSIGSEKRKFISDLELWRSRGVVERES